MLNSKPFRVRWFQGRNVQEYKGISNISDEENSVPCTTLNRSECAEFKEENRRNTRVFQDFLTQESVCYGRFKPTTFLLLLQ